MRCPACRQKNADGVYGCQHCGTPFPCPISKRIFTSPLMLVALIARTATILFALLYTFTNQANAVNAILEPASRLNTGDLNSTATIVFLFISLLSASLSTLTAIGFWMTYASAANRQNAWMKTGGLTIVKVIQCIELVIVGVLIAVIDIGLLSIGWLRIDFPVMLVMVVATSILGLLLFYEILLIQTTKRMIETIRTGIPSDRISSFVAVFTCIAGGIVFTRIFTAGNLIAAIAHLCSATGEIAFGVFLFYYRKQMRAGMTK